LFRSPDVILDATLLSLRPIALGCLRHPGCGHFMRIHDIGELSLGCQAHELIVDGTCRAFFTSNNFLASQPDKAHCGFIFIHVRTSGTLIISVASDTTPIIFFFLFAPIILFVALHFGKAHLPPRHEVWKHPARACSLCSRRSSTKSTGDSGRKYA
jgi:hypothetical protein